MILGESGDVLLNLLQEIDLRLQERGLTINENKSGISSISEGVVFLGYFFDSKGKSIPAKAETNLVERLEMAWITGTSSSIEEKCKIVLEITGGWEQYFREDRRIATIYSAISRKQFSKRGLSCFSRSTFSLFPL